MENSEYKVDRTDWGPGPWDKEPDRIEWRAHGLPCLIVRNRLGNLCGYAGVPPEHPYYKKDYGDCDLDVHGGLTYAAECSEHICHVPKNGEPDTVWWLGFDCAHLGDLVPGMNAVHARTARLFPSLSDLKDFNDTYKTVAYVKEQVESLAAQLASKSNGK